MPNRYSTCEVELRNIDYYSPQEFEFSQLLKENLKKKYKLVFGEEKDFFFKITPFKLDFKKDKK